MRRTASLSSTSHANTLRQQFAAKLDDEGNNDAAQMMEQMRSLKSGQCEKG